MRYFIVDAFAERVFTGGPAGVCVLEQWPDDVTLQNIAAENNMPQTAFVVKNTDGYTLRWFAPNIEVDLCGHATMATAFVISNYVDPGIEQMKFITQSGLLNVLRKDDLYEIELPTRVPVASEVTDEIVEALGIVPIETYKSRDWFLVLENEEQVRNVKPDFAKMAKLSYGDGVIITAEGKETDFVTRCFFPKLMTNEDPVCGSAHCNLIPYWAEKLNKTKMVSRQLSSRGATLYCGFAGDKVKVAGKVALYCEGRIFVPIIK